MVKVVEMSAVSEATTRSKVSTEIQEQKIIERFALGFIMKGVERLMKAVKLLLKGCEMKAVKMSLKERTVQVTCKQINQ